jgi:hypothetical protein
MAGLGVDTVSRNMFMLRDHSSQPDEFAQWLRKTMIERSISGAMLARLVNEQLTEGHFAASNISHYLSGRSHPRPPIREAIERVLASSPPAQEHQPPEPPTVPSAAVVQQGATVPSLQVEDMGEGQARLIINQRLPWQDVLKVLELLKLGDKTD